MPLSGSEFQPKVPPWLRRNRRRASSPDEVAAEIVENLELALERFRKVALAPGRSAE